MKHAFSVASVLFLACTLPTQAATTTWTSSGGTKYTISTSTKFGTCSSLPSGGMECLDGANEITVTDSGCGEKFELASCLVGEPVLIPSATSTLECPDEGVNYVVSDGSNGTCTPNNNYDMTCEDPGTNNYAEASCADGCGTVSGNGSCRVENR